MKEFFSYLFLRRPSRDIDTDTAESVDVVDFSTDPEAHGEGPRQPSEDDLLRNRIIVQINRIIGFICIASFIFILWYAAARSGGEVPDTIKNTFSMTLGYFVSALITFLERRPKTV
jgi:hypothetical protein